MTGLDHLVLTVADVEVSASWYAGTLGMRIVEFGAGRVALHFGTQKLNLHPADAPIAPHARCPLPGTADLCFLTDTPIPEVLRHLAARPVAVEAGPIARTGATGPLVSVYVRDPDGNLIEIANVTAV